MPFLKPLFPYYQRRFSVTASICFMLVTGLTAHAQQHNFRKYDQADGLPATFIYKAVQDTQAYLWFATEKGISRYDGTSFKNYNSDNGFPDYGAFHIVKDSKGIVWFLPFNGKICYFENGRFKIPGIPVIPQKNISWFAEDSKGNYWFSDKEELGSMYKYDPVNHKLHTYKTGRTIFTFCELPGGRMIGNNGAGFIIIDPETGKVSGFPLHNNQDKVYYGRFLKLMDRSVLIATSEGIYRVDSSLQPKPFLPFDENSFYGEVISMYEEDNGDLWIGKQDGAWCFKKGESGLEKAHRFLPGTHITSILKDHEQNYWFTTRMGIFNLRSKSTVNYTTQSGLNTNEVSFIFRGKNYLYIFLSDGYVYALAENGQLKNLDYGAEKYQPVYLHRIYPQPDGKIRMLTWKGELMIDELSVKYTSKSMGPGMENNYLEYMYNNRQWFYDSHGTGVIENGRKKYTSTEIYGPAYASNSICVDKDENIWFGGNAGLFFFTGKQWIDKKNENALFGKSIVGMKRDPEGNVWVATKENGVYTILNGVIVNYTRKDGLLTDHCNSIMVDKQGNLWISSNYGLNKVTLDKNKKITKIMKFDMNNLLLSNEVNSTFQDGQNIYVATREGMTVFEENMLQTSYISPPIYITGLTIGRKDTPAISSFELDYGFGSMQIRYAGISFSPNNNISYRYKMLPIDTGWQYTTLSSLEYSSFAPGDYEFLVSAKNADGIWSSAPAGLQFHIKTPYWQTWWFRVLIFIAFSFVVLLIFYMRLRSSKIKSTQKRKLIEAELQSLRSQMNPHFIFNALNAIQDFVLNNDKENANIYLSKFAGLIRVIMENSKKPFISLSDEIKFLNLYLEIETVRFSRKFSYTIEIDPRVNRGETKVPSMILQPYIENSIKHGLAPKKGSGKLLVKITSTGSQLSCIIEDDGIGRKRSLEAKRPGHAHVSRGMETTKERLRLLNESADVHMDLEIIDLLDAKGEPCGTRVLLTFPTGFHN
jgi:ligand-binding sensor domain-containing protein